MYFFYPPHSENKGAQINIWKWNGTKQYLKHYDQMLYLHFVLKNPRASEQEKRIARHEIGIAEKKLAFWTRHPNFDEQEAQKGAEKLKKMWLSGERVVA